MICSSNLRCDQAGDFRVPEITGDFPEIRRSSTQPQTSHHHRHLDRTPYYYRSIYRNAMKAKVTTTGVSVGFHGLGKGFRRIGTGPVSRSFASGSQIARSTYLHGSSSYRLTAEPVRSRLVRPRHGSSRAKIVTVSLFESFTEASVCSILLAQGFARDFRSAEVRTGRVR